MVQNEHWNGQPRPASKLRHVADACARRSREAGRRRRRRRRCPADCSCNCRAAAARRRAASCNTSSSRPSASPAKIETPRSCASWMSSGISFSIARQPETWNPPMTTWTPGRAQRPGDIECAREFVRLHADDPDKAEAAVVGDLRAVMSRRLDARVGLIDRDDVDGEIGAEHLPLGRTVGEAEDGGKRVRRHRRAEPLHDIAVVVVMRRLNEDQLELTAGRSFCFAHPSILWRRLSREATLRPRPTPPVERFPTLALLNPRDCRMAKAQPPPLLGLNHIPGRGSNE